MPSFWFVLFLYPALFVAVLVHEIGHALFARVAGFAVTSLGLGVSRPFFVVTLPGDIRFFVCRDSMHIGTCWTTTAERLPTRARRALLYVGGGAANLAFALAAFFLWRDSGGGGVTLALFVMNALLGVMNLLPLRLSLPGVGGAKAVASDGLQAVMLFASRRVRAEPPEAELGFRALWQATGDTRTERYRLCLAAFAALDAGDAPGATAFADAAEALPPAPASDVHLLLLCARLATLRGVTETAREKLDAAQAAYTAQAAPGSVFLCRVARLALPGAEKFAEGEILAAPPPARTHLAATRLLLALQTERGEPVPVETLLARYEQARRDFRADSEDAAVYAAVADWRDAHGDATGARVARERAG